jgi:hypothetical protein
MKAKNDRKVFRVPLHLTRQIIVSAFWLYDCIVSKKLIPTGDKLLYFPLHGNKIPEMEQLVHGLLEWKSSCFQKIAVSGFEGPFREYLKELVEITGAHYTGTLSNENHYLICNK